MTNDEIEKFFQDCEPICGLIKKVHPISYDEKLLAIAKVAVQSLNKIRIIQCAECESDGMAIKTLTQINNLVKGE